VAQRQCRGRQAPALEVGIEAWGTNIVIKINKGAALHTESLLKAYHFLQARPDIERLRAFLTLCLFWLRYSALR
jgi:hypothetical protein